MPLNEFEQKTSAGKQTSQGWQEQLKNIRPLIAAKEKVVLLNNNFEFIAPSQNEEVTGDGMNKSQIKDFQEKELQGASRDHIQFQTHDATPSRDFDTSSARDVLRKDMGEKMNVEVLSEDSHETDIPQISPSEAREFATILEQGFSDERADEFVEKNPLEMKIGEIRKKIEKTAERVDEKIQTKEYDDLLGNELGRAIKDLAMRLQETIQRKGMVPEEETKKEIMKLSEEAVTLGSSAWVGRYKVAEEKQETQIPQVAGSKTAQEEMAAQKVVLQETTSTKEPVFKIVQEEESSEPAPKPTEKEQEIKAEIEAVSQFEKLPQEQKLTIFQNIAKIGFTVEQKKNEGLAWVFGHLTEGEKTHDRDKSLKRFLDSTKDIFERDAKRSEQSLADLTAGKEAKLHLFGKDIVDIKTLRGSGFLWGNIMKYGRSIIGPFAWANTGLMMANITLEATKEARLGNEDVIEKTRIQDIDQAEDVARRIYQEAKEKAGVGNSVSKETLEKAYQEGIPKDLLERLAKNIKPGTENGFWQKVLQKDMRGTVEKIEAELTKIDSDANLSAEMRDARKDAYLNNWFTRSQRLKDFDRIVSQNGEIDALASLARYGEFTAKVAVYAMMADSMRRLGMKLAEYFSSSDGVEIIAGAVPVANIQAEIPAPIADNTSLENMLTNTDSVSKNTLADDIINKLKFAKNYELPATTADSVDVAQNAVTIDPNLREIGKIYDVPGSAVQDIGKQLGENNLWNSLDGQQKNSVLDAIKDAGHPSPETPNIEHIMPNAPEIAAISPASVAATTGFPISHDGIVPGAIKIPENILPDQSHMGFSADQGAVIEDSIKIPQEIFPVPTVGHVIAETLTPRQLSIEHSFQELGKTYTVKAGDSVWNIIKMKLGGNEDFAKLPPREQNFIIDSIKDRVVKMSPTELREMDIKGDVNRIYPGDEIKLGKVLTGSEELKKIFSRAEYSGATPSAPVVPAEVPHQAIVPTEIITEPAVSPKAMPIILAQNEGMVTDVAEPIQPKSVVPEIHPDVIPPTGGHLEAFSTRIQNMPFYEAYKSDVYSEIHSQRPDIQLNVYDMPMKEYLAAHPNGLHELSRVFQMKGVETPKLLSQENLNGSVLDWWTKQAIQHDMNTGHLSGHLSAQADIIQQAPRPQAPIMPQNEMTTPINGDAFGVPREQIPSQYPQYIQQGMARQYPDVPPEFYQQRVADMMARNGYNNTVDSVNRMSQIFGVQMPVQFPHQHSNDTMLDVLARAAWWKAQSSGLPPNFPNPYSVLGTVGRVVAPRDQTDLNIGIGDIADKVNQAIGDAATRASINRSMGK